MGSSKPWPTADRLLWDTCEIKHSLEDRVFGSESFEFEVHDTLWPDVRLLPELILQDACVPCGAKDEWLPPFWILDRAVWPFPKKRWGEGA